jgi:NAD(P)-dependent dehydrogenase (short-subunit alcohol dehydrogenase family)
MKEFKDKVAVITGAASGIGRAIADRCAQEGMQVVLADIEEPALVRTAADMRAAGATVLPVLMDVAKPDDVEMLAQETLNAFGAVHMLSNNAGVGAGGSPWESTLKDWQWVLGVNLWGVIHGLRTFVPIMLAQDTEGHIVNTSSVAGLISFHPSASYIVSKHAVVSLSENLYHFLAQRGAKIKTSVLCPGWVNTRILDGERNRPPELQNAPGEASPSPEEEMVLEMMRQAVASGMAPEQVADAVFDAVREERFYIVTHPDNRPMIQSRAQDIVQERAPRVIL